jgi:hypothetical protein
MSNRHLMGSVSGLVLAAVIDLNAPGALAQTKIGVASAVTNQVNIGSRQLATGNNVHANERVRTGDTGAAQLLFIDETSLNIGPKSDVTLDRYVYNPSRGVGSVAMSTTRGALRFVSGSMNPVSYTIKTPSAIIGVRGTVLDIYSTSKFTLMIVAQGVGVANNKQVPAGWAILIGADGSVQGPFQYDATIINIAGPMSFPLFGNAFWGDPRRIELADSAKDIVDQLKGMGKPPTGCGQECKAGQFRVNRGR